VKRAVLAVVVALVVSVATLLGGYAIAGATRGDRDEVLGPGLVTVDVDIRYSTFEFSTLRVRPGTLVRFVVHNRDPIHHELIIGDAAVHARHERGTEAVHPPVPGEVSVKPLDVGTTFLRFDEPGEYFFACHLPRHVAYGMKGWMSVIAE
jgi:uncharacterized cupredoxin-like copper-binding protein